MRFLAGLLLVAVLAAAGAWVYAGWGGPPVIAIEKPDKFLGRTGQLEVAITTPRGALDDLQISIEQNGQSTPVFSLGQADDATLVQESPTRVRVVRSLTRKELPWLKTGEARLTVTAARNELWGWRRLASQESRTLQVRLEPPRVAVVSTHHYVNHGGAELVVYRTSPASVESGVRVGDVAYPGFPLSGAGVRTDPALKMAFFALLHDQDLTTPVHVFAVDEAGNRASTTLDVQPFPKPFRRSRIDITPQFLDRVVPAILENTPDLDVDAEDRVQAFLRINGELREKNAATIAAQARKTAPEMLWNTAFQQLANSAVQSFFADNRTYFYDGKEIDRQVHLGFDLAVTASVPVAAANRGRVVFAEYLGIYGNCVILDHGMGVQSLYAHLSSIDTAVGDTVEKGQVIGRSGMTGLAGGDHLHFTMLVNGHPVNPVEWWDPKWMEDRVLRKIREAAPSDATALAAAVR
ncbi:MAG TPA: M23 family metallopeptidase [Vicinamibacterales bacterium]|nr:M23 family metallopeptidase [Vicinamibacterales bacterium]